MTTPASPHASSDIDVAALIAEAVALRRAGRLDASAQHFDQALARDPAHPGALASYAMLLLEMGDLQRAIDLGRRAILADPSRLSAHHVLGQALCRAGALDEGIAALRRALAPGSDAFEIHVHLGNALAESGDFAGAEEHLVRARKLAPQIAAIAVNLGNLYRRKSNPGAAIACYREAIELDANLPQAYNNLGTVLSEVGDADGAIVALRQARTLAPDRASIWSNLLLAQNRSDRVTAAEFIAEHRAFGNYFGERIRPLTPIRMRPLEGRRLKIGYVSSDFVSHAVALFFEPLLAGHARHQFEIYCFHSATAVDEVTHRIEGLAEHFIPVANLSDGDLAERIRAEAIDILIDLNGHTAQNRLTLFLLKPAPIEVTWLGYLATTGLTTIDYRLTDARADPPGLTEALHTETLWRLPDTSWCYQPYSFAPEVGALPAQQRSHVTFACLNSPAKVSPAVIGLWAQILAAVPGSRLLLMNSGVAERNADIDRICAERGVAPDRVERLPRQSTVDYLALHNRVDIALDSWPYTGGTTTCDALWMGVPLVTQTGSRSVSRSGASLLFSVGLPELIADDPHDYVERAVMLARDRSRLAHLRVTLRERMRASPLTDAARFARAVEAAYTAMAARGVERQ